MRKDGEKQREKRTVREEGGERGGRRGAKDGGKRREGGGGLKEILTTHDNYMRRVCLTAG